MAPQNETEEETKIRKATERQQNTDLKERQRIAKAEKKRELEDENAALKKEITDKEAADNSSSDIDPGEDGAGILTKETQTRQDRDNADREEIAIVLDSHWQRLGAAPADITDRERDLRTAHLAKYKRLAALVRKQIK